MVHSRLASQDEYVLRTLHKSYRKHPTPSKLERILSDQKLFTHECTEAKASYESKLISDLSNSNSSVFKYISHIRSGGNIPPIVCHKEAYASTDDEKADLFNNYFHSVFVIVPLPYLHLEIYPVLN